MIKKFFSQKSVIWNIIVSSLDWLIALPFVVVIIHWRKQKIRHCALNSYPRRQTSGIFCSLHPHGLPYRLHFEIRWNLLGFWSGNQMTCMDLSGSYGLNVGFADSDISPPAQQSFSRSRSRHWRSEGPGILVYLFHQISSLLELGSKSFGLIMDYLVNRQAFPSARRSSRRSVVFHQQGQRIEASSCIFWLFWSSGHRLSSSRNDCWRWLKHGCATLKALWPLLRFSVRRLGHQSRQTVWLHRNQLS